MTGALFLRKMMSLFESDFGQTAAHNHSNETMPRSAKADAPERLMVSAILVDGRFYRKRAFSLLGEKTPAERADELQKYCERHIKAARSNLYKIFYYDYSPCDRIVFHPLLKTQINLAKTRTYEWTQDFFTELTKRRKMVIRRAASLENHVGYALTSQATKQLCAESIDLDDLGEEDFKLNIPQKGLGVRIGLDVASLAARREVNQIIMISADSDFIGTAKYARREGLDFVLDPMWVTIADNLNEHIDSVRQCVAKPPKNESDPLYSK